MFFMLLQPVISIISDDIYLHCQCVYIAFDNISLHCQCNRLAAICYWLIVIGHCPIFLKSDPCCFYCSLCYTDPYA